MPYKNPIKQKEAQHRSYLKNKNLISNRMKQSRINNKKFIESIKVICNSCGENDVSCLDFHHKDPKNKDKSISIGIREWGITRLKKEISKCEILCSNCHRKLHSKINNLSKKRAEKQKFLNLHKENHPCKCGESTLCCLIFHHKNKKSKEISISNAMLNNKWSLEKLKEEMLKCEVLCSNCHRKLHKLWG